MNLYAAKITMGGEPVQDTNEADEIAEVLVGPDNVLEAEDPDEGRYLIQLCGKQEKEFLKKGHLEISDDFNGEHTIIIFEGD